MLNSVIRLIFPSKCIFCSKIIRPEADIDICRECFAEIPFLPPQPAEGQYNIFLNRYCDKVVCACEYTGIIKKALIQFKFYNKPSFYRTLGRLLAHKVAETIDCEDIDMVVSIPLYRKKQMKRGYNQAALIGRVLSREWQVPDCSAILKKVKDTRSQRLLDRKDRYRNLQDAFTLIDPDIVVGMNIVLVDDIFTTGSTVGECARILKEAGADKVIAAVIASGRKY